MNSDIQQILLAQASREAEQGPKLSDMVALGAGGGAAIGGLMGRGIGGRKCFQATEAIGGAASDGGGGGG